MRLVAAPDDQADGARRLAVDEDLARLHDHGVGDRRIRDGDARDVEVGRQHRRAAGRQVQTRENRLAAPQAPAPRSAR